MKQLVITVHGIRTFGDWQGRLAALLKQQAKDREVEVIEYNFGFFSALAFMVPFVRMLIVRRFRKYFVSVATASAWDRIDLVGHSFGTHVIAWALHRINSAKPPQVNTVIFAGSVLKTNFPWQDLIGRSVKRVVNDCGMRDDVLVLNQIFILGTGMAGRLGFNGGTGDNFRNRFFDCGHSGYFFTDDQPDDAFMRKYWVPLLLEDRPPEVVDLRKAGVMTGVALWLLNNSDPVKLVVVLLPFVWFTIHYYRLEKEAVTQRNVAQSELLTTQNLLAKFSDLVAERLRPIAKLDEVDTLLSEATNLIPEPQRSDLAIPYASLLLTEADINWERRRIREMYNFATQAAKALAKSDQSKLEVRHLLARADEFDGLYFAESAAAEPNTQKMQDDFEQARGYYTSALERLSQLKDRYNQTSSPDNDWRWLRSFGLALMAMGDLQLAGFGKADDAKTYYQQAHDIWITLSGLRSNDREITYELDWTDNKLGDVFWAQGNDESALQEFEKAEGEIKPLIGPFDSDHKWLNFLAVVQNNIGIQRAALGQFEEAINAFQNAIDNLDQLLKHDSNQSTWRSNLAWTYDNMGETKTRWARRTKDGSRLSGADNDLDRAILDLGQLAQSTDNPRWKATLAMYRADLEAYRGTKLELAHDCRGAADAYVRAAAADPITVTDAGVDLLVLRKAELLEWAAADYRRSGNDSAATATLLEAKAAVDNHAPKFSGRGASLAALKLRIEQDIQATAQPGQNVCD
jgi:tetratricopeptide (TPR) repeat protein